MTTDEYRKRVLSMEKYVARQRFVCPWDAVAGEWACGPKPWWPHAEAAISYLGSVIDADFYGVERDKPDTGWAHLDRELLDHLKILEERWPE